MDEKGMELSQKFAQLVIDAALQAQGTTLVQQLARDITDATHGELTRLGTAIATVHQDQSRIAQVLQQDVRISSQAAQRDIGLLTQSIQQQTERAIREHQAAEARNSALQQQLLAISESARAPTSDVKRLRQEVAQAFNDLGHRLEDEATARASAILGLNHAIDEVRALLSEATRKAPLPPKVETSAVLQESGHKATKQAEPATTATFAWIRSLGGGRGILTGLLVGVLSTLLITKLAQPPAPLLSPTPALPPHTQPSRPIAAKPSVAGTPSLPDSTPPPSPQPRSADTRTTTPPAASPSPEDLYVGDLISELLKAGAKDQALQQQMKLAFKDSGIGLSTEAADRPAVAMHHLEAIAVPKRQPALAGFMLQALLLREGQSVGKLDGKVGPATVESLAKTKCISKSAELRKDPNILREPKEHWISVIKACAAR